MSESLAQTAIFVIGGEEMVSADNLGYVKHAMAGLLALTLAPSAAFAEIKFLSLVR